MVVTAIKPVKFATIAITIIIIVIKFIATI